MRLLSDKNITGPKQEGCERERRDRATWESRNGGLLMWKSTGPEPKSSGLLVRSDTYVVRRGVKGVKRLYGVSERCM